MYKLILFDMDETLYPRDTTLMPQVTGRIMKFIEEKVGLTAEQSALRRRQYREKYGTALRGLMEDGHLPDQASIDVYLDYVHDIPLEGVLTPDPAVREMLLALPLRRGVLTSSNIEQADRVLRFLNIHDCFEHVIDIRAVNFINKPHRGAYETALERFGVQPHEAIFVEDLAMNTKPAKAMGIKTILVDHVPTEDADFVVSSVVDVAQVVAQLMAQVDL
jgi:putative hydrolase of the HAD superfamily